MKDETIVNLFICDLKGDYAACTNRVFIPVFKFVSGTQPYTSIKACGLTENRVCSNKRAKEVILEKLQ